MRPISIFGIVLIIVGILVLAFQGITYTKSEKIIDIGPIQATAEHRKTVPISPIAGGAALVAGIALVVVGNKQRSA